MRNDSVEWKDHRGGLLCGHVVECAHVLFIHARTIDGFDDTEAFGSGVHGGWWEDGGGMDDGIDGSGDEMYACLHYCHSGVDDE